MLACDDKRDEQHNFKSIEHKKIALLTGISQDFIKYIFALQPLHYEHL